MAGCRAGSLQLGFCRHTKHTIVSTQKCRQIEGEKNWWRPDFDAVGRLWSWVFNSFGQVCVPSFDCKEFMLVTLMNLGLESAAVKLVRCLLELNIGKSDKMSSWVPFLWFYEQIPACIWTYRTFASIKTVCWWLLEGVNRAVKWHFHYSETLESCVPSLVVPLHCECYSFVTG